MTEAHDGHHLVRTPISAVELPALFLGYRCAHYDAEPRRLFFSLFPVLLSQHEQGGKTIFDFSTLHVL